SPTVTPRPPCRTSPAAATKASTGWRRSRCTCSTREKPNDRAAERATAHVAAEDARRGAERGAAPDRAESHRRRGGGRRRRGRAGALGNAAVDLLLAQQGAGGDARAHRPRADQTARHARRLRPVRGVRRGDRAQTAAVDAAGDALRRLPVEGRPAPRHHPPLDYGLFRLEAKSHRGGAEAAEVRGAFFLEKKLRVLRASAVRLEPYSL